MSKRIIIKNADGSICILIPSPDCGLTMAEIAEKDCGGLPYEIVDTATVPSDRTFRNAWKHDPVKKVDVDVPKAKLIAHEIRRAKRANEFAPYDAIIAMQIPGTSAQDAEAARVLIREKYATIQIDIDNAVTTEQLRAIIQ